MTVMEMYFQSLENYFDWLIYLENGPDVDNPFDMDYASLVLSVSKSKYLEDDVKVRIINSVLDYVRFRELFLHSDKNKRYLEL